MKRTSWIMTATLCGSLLVVAGCGDDERAAGASDAPTANKASHAYQGVDAAYDVAGEWTDEGFISGRESESAPRTIAVADVPAEYGVTRGDNAGATVEQTKIERKIIYNASLEVVVDDFEGVEAKVAAVVRQYDGFMASSNVRGEAGRPRHGRFVIRVPSTNFDDFMEGAESIGDVRERRTDSQEVTAEFVDLQSRIRNKQTEEERLIQLLKQATGKLEEVLKVEKELSRVRQEVETMQGRLRVLSDLTSLATVTLNVQEIKEYVPNEAEAPGFFTRIARSFGGSVGGIIEVFQGIIIGIAAMVPWLIVIALPLYFFYRYAKRRNWWRPPQRQV